jgi:predicted pyridoxine 5'-phosphate oxidase superfamily flavin-nucleotide-binding protein
MTDTLRTTPVRVPNEYHEGNRQLQDRFDSRRLADRVGHMLAFSEQDRAIIEQCCFFFLATADAAGHPDVSYKGGLPGFVRITGEDSLAFPDYDGNGQFRSLGNIFVNPHVALIFVDFQGRGRKRVKGEASVSFDDPLLAEYPDAQAIVRVRATEIFGNCPRYIHKMELVEHSVYVPRAEHTPPVPDWKLREEYRDVLPRREARASHEVPGE